mgnify:CR=1 FL=1
MRTTKRVLQAAGITAGAIGAIAATAPGNPIGRGARRLGDRLTRDLRYAAATTPGLVYRLAGRYPDPDVSDQVIADRVRSKLGPIEHRFDLPRIDVRVEDHVARLEGNVTRERDTTVLERAALAVSGVRGVESHLHAGLGPGDTRPSSAHAHRQPPSAPLTALLDAAGEAGAQANPEAAVHAVLCGFTDRLPETERARLLAHLPPDARALAGPPRRRGEQPPRLKTVPQLVAAVVAEGGVNPSVAEDVTRSVIHTLRLLVPEEGRDIASVLPSEIRHLWRDAARVG